VGAGLGAEEAAVAGEQVPHSAAVPAPVVPVPAAAAVVPVPSAVVPAVAAAVVGQRIVG
jgi:hypothetical protein